jgi:hypothetical protein
MIVVGKDITSQVIDMSKDLEYYGKSVVVNWPSVTQWMFQAGSESGLARSSCLLKLGDQLGRYGATTSANVCCHSFHVGSIHTTLVHNFL